jgi:hypothetical protein
VGSGLVVLVIVGAWLAVLVPMALRSEVTPSSVERFGTAVRVLARRTGRRTDDEQDDLFGAATAGDRSAQDEGPAAPPAFEPLLHRFRDDPPRAPLSPVARRRRVLLTLVGATVLSLLGGLLTPWLFLLGVVLLGLCVAYVAHLRRLEVQRAERQVRSAGGRSTEPEWASMLAEPERPVRRAPLPVPPRWEPAASTGEQPLWEQPAARQEPAAWEQPLVWEQPAARALPAAADGEWSPVPVPPPVYVGKPVATPRPPRAAQPGGWDRVQPVWESGDEDVELDDILDGRRVVGGW